MARVFNEEQFIENNLFEYEKRLNSPYNKYQNKSSTYVTYYHIDNKESLADEGFKDIESILGPRSPIRYKKIKNFPIYGIEQIVINLDEEEQGLDGSYSGRGDILPNTIKPLENDFFLINHLKTHDAYLFRVTSVIYDNIKTDNYYSVEFILDAIDEEAITKIENQVIDEYKCISDNIGTDEKCIIQEEVYNKILDVSNMYNIMKDTYLSIFYSDRYNCLLGDFGAGRKLYDPYMSIFCNEHDLFNERNELNTYILSEEIIDPRMKLKYEKTVYRFIERREPRLLQNFVFEFYSAMKARYTAFAKWYDSSVFILDIPDTNYHPDCETYIFSNEFIKRFDEDILKVNSGADLIIKYIKDKEIGIKDIPLDLHENLMSLNANLEFFFTTPLLMYIIKKIVRQEQLDKTQ